MSSEASTVALAALMDAVSLLRGEVAALAQSNARLEAYQREIHRRLDVIDTSLAPLPDLLPYQEAILTKTLEGDYATHEWLKALAPVLDRIVEQSAGDRESIGMLHQDVIRVRDIAGAGQKGTAEVALGLEVIAGRLEEAASAARKERKAGFTTTAELIGYRRLAILLRREGNGMNLKKVYRLYREERLTVRKRGGRKRALGMRAPMAIPQERNQRWSLDNALGLVGLRPAGRSRAERHRRASRAAVHGGQRQSCPERSRRGHRAD